MTTLYGIKNCDTMKKARQWLDERGIAYQFHDYKKFGLAEQQLRSWVRQTGWERLVNTRGTTWRKLPESERANLDEGKAVVLMLANLSLIKRPVLEHAGALHVGFSVAEYEQIFG